MRCRSILTLFVLIVLFFSTISVNAVSDNHFNKLISSGRYKDAIEYADNKLPVADRDSDVWAKLGIAHEAQGLVEKALACFMVAIRLDQKNYEAYLGAARVYNKLDQPDGALDMAKKAMELKQTGEASWAFAQACIAQNKVAEAKTALEKVCEMDPSNMVAHQALGNVLFKEKKYAKAVQYLRKAYKAKPDGATALDLAVAYRTIGKLDTTIIYYKDALKYDTSDKEKISLELARIYFSKKQYKNSVESYSSINRNKLSSQDLFDYATGMNKIKDDKNKIIEIYQAALKKAGKNQSKEILTAQEILGRHWVAEKKYSSAVTALEYVRSKTGGNSKADTEILFLLADSYNGLKKRTNAIALLEAVIARDKKNVEAYARLADLYTKEKMGTKAKAVFEKLLSLQPNNPDVYYSLGEYYFKVKNYKEALKYYQKSFTLDASSKTALGMMNAAWNGKRYDIARDAAESALHKDGKLVEPQIILAKILFINKNYKGAAARYYRLLKNDEKNLDYLNQLAVCYEKLGNKDELADVDKKIIAIDKKNMDARLRFAYYSKAKGDLKTAKEHLDILVKMQPKKAELYKTLYEIAIDTKDKKSAINYLKSYLALNAKDAKLHKELGDLLYESGDKSGALSSYRTALKTDASIKGLYKRYAELIMSKKEKNTAEQKEVLNVLNSAVKAGEADAEIYATLGTIYKNQKNYPSAIGMFQKALKRDPKDMESLLLLAYCQEKSGKMSDAIISYEQASVLNPKNTDALKSLGNLYSKTGKKTQAIKAYKKYLGLASDDNIAIYVGNAALTNKQYKEAVTYYGKVKGSAANTVAVIENYAKASYEAGNMVKAEELLKLLTVKAPKKSESFKKLYAINVKNGKKKEAANYLTKYVQANPRDVKLLIALGDLQYELKNGKEAIAAYRNALKANPKAKGFYKKYLELTGKHGTSEEKVRALKMAVAAGEADAKTYEQLGNTYIASKNYAKALEYYKKASSLDPKSITALRSVGICQEKTGAVSASIVTMEQVVALDPTAKKELKTLGDLYLKQKKEDNAVKYYKQYLKKVEDDNIALLVAEHAYKKKEYTEAVLYYGKVKNTKLHTQSFLSHYGQACLKTQNIDKGISVYKQLVTIAPKNAEVHKYLFDLLFKKNQKNDALVYLKKYVALKPTDADAQKTLGDMLYARKQKAGAISAYQAALKANPNSTGFHKKYAQLVIERGVDKDIESALSTAVKSGEADVEMYKKLAAIYVKQKKYQQAIPLFEKALQEEPKNIDLLSDLASAQAKGGNTSAAILTYEQVVTFNKKAVTELKELGNLYKVQKKWDQAIKNYIKYLENKKENAIALEVAQYYLKKKKYTEAVKYFDMLTGAAASDVAVVKSYAEAALLAKDKKKALSLYKKIIAFEPNNTKALKKLYEVSASTGNTTDVIYYLKKYVQLRPTDADAQKRLGDLLYDKKDKNGALKAYRATYKANPKVSGYFKKFASLLYAGGSDREVIAVLNSAIAAKEADSDMYVRLGDIYLKMKNYPKAISLLEKASQLDPKNTTVMKKLAEAQVASGKKSAAILTYEQVIAMNTAAEMEYKELGDLYWQQKKKRQALSNYAKYLGKKQDNAIASRVANEYLAMKKYKEAVKYFEMVSGKESSNAIHLKNFGKACVLTKDSFRAYQIYRQLSNITPKDPEVFKNLYTLAEKAGTKDDVLKYLKRYTELKPSDATALARLGDMYMSRNEDIGALGAYRAVAKADTSLRGFYKNYASLVIKHGTTKEQYIVLKRAISVGEADAKIYRTLGEIYIKNKQYSKADAAFEKASQLDPKNDKILTLLAQSQLKKGDLKKAALTYEQVVAMNPRADNELKQLGSIYMKLGKDSLAVTYYKKYLDKKPGDSDIAFEVGKIMVKMKQYNNAMKYLGMVKGAKSRGVTFIKMYAEASYKTKKYPIAAVQYSKLAKLTPKDATIYKHLYEIYMKTGAKNDALANLYKYTLYRPKDADAQKKLADMYYDKDDKLKALAAYRRALRADPKIKGIYKNYVNLVLKYGKYTEKMSALNGAIASGEADAVIYNAAGTLYASTKKYKTAVKYYTEAIKKDPKDFKSYVSLSECLVKIKDLTSAAVYLEKALKVNPAVKSEYKQLGDLYIRTKNTKNAIKAYETYLGKVPTDERIAKKVAQYYYDNKQFAKAYKYFGMVKTDKSAKFMISYGMSALYSDDYPNAILILEKVRTSKTKIGNRDVAYKALAEAYEKQKKPEMAVKVLYDYIKLPGVKDPDAAYRIAAVYESMDLDKAVKLYKENIAKYPKDHRNFVKLGFYYSKKMKDEKEAINYLKKAVAITDTVPDVWLELGTLYSKKGQANEMLKAYRKYIQIEPSNVTVQARIGEELLGKDMVEDAMVFLEMANAQKPNDPKFMTLLARGYLLTERPNEGVRLIEEVKKITKGRIDDDLRVALADVYIESGQEKKAINELKRIMKTNNSPKVLTKYAKALFAAGKEGDALKIAERVKAQKPNDIDVYMMIGKIKVAQKKYNDAIETYKEILYMDQNYAPALCERANVYLLQKKYQWAQTFYDRALKVNPDDGLIYLGLARLAKAQKDFVTYTEMLEKARKRSPNNREILKELRDAKQ